MQIFRRLGLLFDPTVQDATLLHLTSVRLSVACLGTEHGAMDPWKVFDRSIDFRRSTSRSSVLFDSFSSLPHYNNYQHFNHDTANTFRGLHVRGHKH